MSLPRVPLPLRGGGRIIHLISGVAGEVRDIRHLEEIRAMPSVRGLTIDVEVGGTVERTVDIRTDAGYVVLQHGDPGVVQRDFDRIVALQETMFDVS